MKIVNYEAPQSSFLALKKDSEIIMRKLLSNDKLKKLLYKTERHCLAAPNLTREETLDMIGRHIRFTPKYEVENDVKAYIAIIYDMFVESPEHHTYRDNVIRFDIVCHLDQFELDDFGIRPYEIAGEIDSMFNNSKLSGIGEFSFYGGTNFTVNDEFSGFSLVYNVTHGKEDRVE